jgi:hypothetical protein
LNKRIKIEAFIREAIPKIGQKKASAFGCRRFFVGIKKIITIDFKLKNITATEKKQR